MCTSICAFISYAEIIIILLFKFPGNFVVDIMHNVTKADVVLLNAGTLRSDTIHPPGVFKKKVIG
jgi:hypothetical protein